MQKKFLLYALLATPFIYSCSKSDDHSLLEKSSEEIQEVGNDLKRDAEKAVRDAKDESCEMINGKVECAAKKVKHSIQNGADAVEDAID